MSKNFAILVDRGGRGSVDRYDERAFLRRRDIVGLVTKTNTNPFFVKMKQGFRPKPRSSASPCRPTPASTTATTTARSPRSRR